MPLPTNDRNGSGLSRLLPSIPDVLGWVLTFFIVWLIYTGITKGVELLRSVEFSAPDTSPLTESLPTKDVGERVKSALDSVATDVTESLDELSRKAREQKQRISPQSELPKTIDDDRERLQRF